MFFFFKIENEIDKTKEYLLVTEYADSGNLQNYLKNNLYRLTRDNKYELAYQLACAVSYLHEEEIVHLDLVIFGVIFNASALWYVL